MDARILTLFDLEPIEPPVAPKKRATKAAKTKPEQSEDPLADIAITTIEQKNKPLVVTKEKQVASAQKNYYSIGETAKMFSVRTSHIRFWTVQFAIKVRTTRKGDRLYTPENIEYLKQIHELVKVQGFTIAGAKAKLKEPKPNTIAPATFSPNAIIIALQALRENLISLRSKI